ncbi:MAG: hypothetical protein KHY08_10245 [Lachnospiraceae bacterium]|nr:hypothetical protein [Lachnospiraceae bacterium]
MKIKITLFACEKEFSATADTIAEAYEYIKAAMKLNKNAFPDMDDALSEYIEILTGMKSGERIKHANHWFEIEKI